jgi:hypothetical protein
MAAARWVSPAGAVTTTVRATASGSWRFVFAGNGASGAATSAADTFIVKWYQY